MSYFPMLLQMGGRDCLVVGGGEVARRKVESLVDCGARVTVVTEAACEGIRSADRVTLILRSFEEGDVDGKVLAIAATDDEDVNRRVAAACRAAGIPVNVADRQELCDFLIPAVVRRGDLVVAISTAGAAPILSGRLRQELERYLPPYWGPYVATLRRLREVVTAQVADAERRRTILEHLTEPQVVERIEKEGLEATVAYMEALVADAIDGS